MQDFSTKQKSNSIRWVSFFFGILTGVSISKVFKQSNKKSITGEIEVLFTYPKSFRQLNFLECEQKIIQLITKAEKSIYLQSYSFTSQNIVNALIEAKRRGIIVQLLLDKENEIKPSEGLLKLIESGLSVKIRRISGISHSKILIVDEAIVQTGSYNYTRNANERNDENIILIYNSPAIVKSYLENWKKCNREASYIWGGTQKTKPWQDTSTVIPKLLQGKTALVKQLKRAQLIPSTELLQGEIKLDAVKGVLRPKAYLERITQAQKSIWISSNREIVVHLLPILMDLAKKGLDIRVLLHDKQDANFLKLCKGITVRQSPESKQKTYLILDKKTLMQLNVKGDYSVISSGARLERKLHHFHKGWVEGYLVMAG